MFRTVLRLTHLQQFRPSFGPRHVLFLSTQAHSDSSTTTPPQPFAASTEPSTAHALPLPGGNTTRAHRLEAHATILNAYNRISHANTSHSHARLHPADIVPAGRRFCFVGVGLTTNWAGLLTALEGRAFNGTPYVVVVRDVFDRCDSRRCLSDWFAVIADDIVAVHSDLLTPEPRRRIVNVYMKQNDGDYHLVQNDVDFVEYLHSSGWRVVPVSSKHDLEQLRSGNTKIPIQQSTNHVLACAPTAFSYNVGAATDNHFMNEVTTGLATNHGHTDGQDDMAMKLRRQVLTEFGNLHAKLIDRRDGVGAHVHLFTHEDWHHTPDACFPNNTFSTHTNLETGDTGVLVLYPMRDETRRKERRLVQRLLTRGKRYSHVYDMTREESSDRAAFLEGTGSLVLDRVNRIAYVALSARSDLRLARTWGRMMNYTVVPFTSVDEEQRPIYHTNVMMAVGSRVAVVCGESIVDQEERETVVGTLQDTGHDVIMIDYEQTKQFCGNVIELEGFYGQQMLVMSTKAHNGFTQEQRERMLEGVQRLVHADISTIERVGGGGVRCTIAELF